MQQPKTPAEAVDLLEQLYDRAVTALIESVRRFAENGAPPTDQERALFRYPELRVTYLPGSPTPRLARAYGALHAEEEYLCRFGVNPAFRAALVSGPLREAAVDETGDLRAVELDAHPFFVARCSSRSAARYTGEHRRSSSHSCGPAAPRPFSRARLGPELAVA